MALINVAVIGMGFGAEFVPIYLQHPEVGEVVICDAEPERLSAVADRFQLTRTYRSFDDLLACDDLDAIHIVSGIPAHAGQAVKALQAGKHCACTVPMATSLADLNAIVAAQRASGKNYMMMETAVYTRHFFYVKELLESGQLGKIQFLRGAHYQDMEAWPPYWAGLPPMHYATHAVAPLLALAQTRASSVRCLGSGTMRPELHEQYGNPYPVETAIFELEGIPAIAEVTRSLFHVAKAYVESFTVLGDTMSFEWALTDDGTPTIFRIGDIQPHRGRPVTMEEVTPPDRAELLPPSVGRFTRSTIYDESNPHLSFVQGGGHHGSHPHLVHEFITSIKECHQPWINAVTAANWTVAGICAHESAMLHGAIVDIPRFDAKM